MREITSHVVNPVNDKIKIEVTDAPGATDLRRGPPFEVAHSTAQTEPQVAPAADAAASGDTPKYMADPAPASQRVVTRKTTSTKSGVEQPAAQTGADAGRYVQVATFKSVANALTAKNMVVSEGMNGQLRTANQKGASFHLVLAGPFDPAEIQTALARVTRLGFMDAFIVR